MIKQTLNAGWTVRAVSNPSEVPTNVRDAAVPANVPGCVHTDLLRAGLIADPYYGLNETKLLWIGNTDWQYRTSFVAEASLFDERRIDLVFDGLDTVATIELNGKQIAQTFNQHRGYRIDVREHLTKGSNELVITFASPVHYAQKMHDELGHRPATSYGGKFNFIRKMACNFGWDWGPVVPTSGIWKDVRIEAWSKTRIESVRPEITSLSERAASVSLFVDLETNGDEMPSLSAVCKSADGSPAFGQVEWKQLAPTRFRGDFEIASPRLWWPAGHGEPYRYSVSVSAGASTFDFKLGLRAVELDTSRDEIGRQFTIKVNGKPVFCKGFNWIPDDCFLDRANDPARLRRRITQAAETHANMLRVWGGGIYETDAFYDICDELGIMVWQDFLFACAAYPEEEPIRSEVEAEVRYNIARLAHHPSLVLWNGCNENIWGYHVWSHPDENGVRRHWKDQLKGKTWGAGFYLDLLPRLCRELDPSRPYWEASPWSGDRDIDNGLHPNLSTHGNKHIWEVWHGPGDYNNYRWFAPRFCSEFGYQGPANYATIARWFEPEEMKRGSATNELHQKSPGGNERNDRLLQKDFDIPENFDDWHYLLQLNQARALTTGVEWFRSRQPVCMGTLYWQLNDCYPVTSWAAIDGDGRLKPLWFSTQRFYAPRILTIQPEADTHVLHANNDADQPWRGEAIVRRMDFAGRELARISVHIDAAPRSNFRAAILPVSIVVPHDKCDEFVVASFDGAHATWYFAPDRELRYPPAEPACQLDKTSEGLRLNVASKSLIRDLVVNIDRLDPDAAISDNVVTILPGQTAMFDIKTSKPMTLEQLTTPPVMQCANRFGKK